MPEQVRAAASQEQRRFLQFTMRQLLLLLAVSGVLLGIVAPRIHQTFRSWRQEQTDRRINSATRDLVAAVNSNDVSLARRLLEAGADPNAVAETFRNRVIVTSIKRGHVDMLKLLLDFGANPEGTERAHFDSPSGEGLPFCVAVGCQQPSEVRCQMIRVLVAAGADPLIEGGGRNAMDIAVHESDSQMGDLLREYGLPYGPREMVAFGRLEELRLAVQSDPEIVKQRFSSLWARQTQDDEPTLLALSLFRGNREMSLFLIDAGSPLDTRQHLGRTLLHEAAIGGDPELVRLLVARGLDVNAVDAHVKESPLQFACRRDNVEVVAALLEAGADLNYQDASGDTSLHGAVWGNRVEIVRPLLAAGADPTIANMKGEAPLDVARARHPELVGLLEQAAEGLSKE